MGSGQCTGWAGLSWFTVADIILTGLSENQPGMVMVSPDVKTEDFRAAEASVDDSRQGVNTAGVENYNREHKKNLDIGHAANQASQAFERYLTLTGGRLALDKTMFYALFPEHRKIMKQYKPEESLEIEMVLTENFSDTKKKLKMYRPEEAHKLLGVLTGPASTMKKKIMYMESQSRTWNEKLLCAPSHQL